MSIDYKLFHRAKKMPKWKISCILLWTTVLLQTKTVVNFWQFCPNSSRYQEGCLMFTLLNFPCKGQLFCPLSHYFNFDIHNVSKYCQGCKWLARLGWWQLWNSMASQVKLINKLNRFSCLNYHTTHCALLVFITLTKSSMEFFTIIVQFCMKQFRISWKKTSVIRLPKFTIVIMAENCH